jgi:hypothetical protein
MWTFTTAGAAVEKVVLLSPGNYTIQPYFPTLSWNAVTATGVVNYQVQVDNNFSFNSITWETTTTATSVIPTGSFVGGLTYYWRVRALTPTATGAWSDIWSFYYGSPADIHDHTRLTWADPDSFGVIDTHFQNGASNLTQWPQFTIVFSSAPATGFETQIITRKKSVYPRTDVSDDFLWKTWEGTWVQSGNTITFTPSGATPELNTRYEIIISKRLQNTDGVLLNEDYAYFVTGKYDPYFADVYNLRNMFGAELKDVPDDYINFVIHKVSLEARARYAAYLYGTDVLSPDESIVRDDPGGSLKGWAVLKWTEAMAAYVLLRGILFEEVRYIGRDRQLGSYKESLSGDFIDGIKEALKMLKNEVEEWESLLGDETGVDTTVRMINWSPDLFDYDPSIRVESSRDDWLRGG